MAHNIEISIHSFEQAEELSRRLHRYLTRIDDRPPARRGQWYMKCIDDPTGGGESTEMKASRIHREDKAFWFEIRALFDFLKCEDLDKYVRTSELSKDNNRQTIQHFFIPSLSEYLMDTHFGLNYCHPVVLEMLLKLDLMSDVLQILKLRPASGVIKSFASGVYGGEGDHWLGVHYHCIRIFSYLLNAYLGRGSEEPRSQGPLVKLMDSGGGMQILLKCVEKCINPKSDDAYVIPGLSAVVALYDMFDVAPKLFGKLLTAANGITTLGYFLYRDNTMKVLGRIMKRKQLYKFEEYAMKTSPWNSVPCSLNIENTDVTHFSEDMTTPEASYHWAHYLRIYSINILVSTITDDETAKRILTEDKLCMKAIMDWFKCPQRYQRDELTVECTVKLVFYLVQNRQIAKLMVSNYHLLKVLEAVVFFPSSPVIIHGYLEIIACLLNEPSSKDKIIERENLVFAMSNYAFSMDEKLRNMALTNLLRMSRTNSEGAKQLIKYFGPREIYLYPCTFTKTKGKWNSLLKDYRLKLTSANDKVFTQEAQKTIDHLDRAESVELKVKGNKMFKEGKFEAAIKAYSRAIHVCPYVKINMEEKDDKKRKNPYLWESLRVTLISNRAQCYMNLKMYKEALDDCNRVVALSGHTENEETAVIMLKGLFRRARTLYELKYYHRSLADICRCLLMDEDNEKFKDFLGKVILRYRKRYGPEVLLSCDECGGGVGAGKLRRCKRCTAAYCSQKCQTKAWAKLHKANCEEFAQDYPGFGK